jgi:hypothetical protein
MLVLPYLVKRLSKIDVRSDPDLTSRRQKLVGFQSQNRFSPLALLSVWRCCEGTRRLAQEEKLHGTLAREGTKAKAFTSRCR